MRLGLCIHFSGLGVRREQSVCRKGHRYGDFTNIYGLGAMYRLPCTQELREEHPKSSCVDCVFPTVEEVEKSKAEFSRHVAAIIQILPLLKSEKYPIGFVGHIDCPICKGSGTLHFSIHAKRHVHARCTTTGCVQFME